MQDNLVSVTGLPIEYDDPDVIILLESSCSGIVCTSASTVTSRRLLSAVKVWGLIMSLGKHNRTAFIQVYITYEKPIDAAFAIKVSL